MGLLKRSCVRLIAVVCSEQREAQDAVREAGGINLILGMCQINDANLSKWPRCREGEEEDDGLISCFVIFSAAALREHALLAVRNVLKNNKTNQELM